MAKEKGDRLMVAFARNGSNLIVQASFFA